MQSNRMIKLAITLSVFASGLIVGATMRSATNATTTPQLWPVVNIVDGDTLDILYQPPYPVEERVRLIQVNTPERGDPGFQEATEALERLVAEGQVSIELESCGEHERGAYGRLLVYIFCGGKCVNLEIVRLGWSRNYTEYGAGRMNQLFAEAEQEAREAQRGLWASEWANIGG